jgi:hypothetical protein
MTETRQSATTPAAGEPGPVTPGQPETDHPETLAETVATLETKLAALEQSLEGTARKLADTERELALAVNSYKANVITANPQVPAELITGDNITSVDASLQTAHNLVERVRAGLEAEIQTGRVPAGAPGRLSPDLSSLSARDKIRHGMSER